MAAAVNGVLPTWCQRKRLPTTSTASTWGDPSITMPLHSELATTLPTRSASTSSCISDGRGPPTSPKSATELDPIIVLENDNVNSDHRYERASITITIPLPWTRRRSKKGALLAERKDVGKMPLADGASTTLTSHVNHLNENVNTSTSNGGSSLPSIPTLRGKSASQSTGNALSPVDEGAAREDLPAQSVTVLTPCECASARATMQQHTTKTSTDPPMGTTCNSINPAGPRSSSSLSSRRDKNRQAERSSPQIGIGVTGRMRASSQDPAVGHRRSASNEDSLHSGMTLIGLGVETYAASSITVSRRNSYHNPNIAPTRRLDPSPATNGMVTRRRSSILESSSCRAASVDLHEPKISRGQTQPQLTSRCETIASEDPSLAFPSASQSNATPATSTIERPIPDTRAARHTPTPYTSPSTSCTQFSHLTRTEPQIDPATRSRTVYDDVKDDYRRLICDVAATTMDSTEASPVTTRRASKSSSTSTFRDPPSLTGSQARTSTVINIVRRWSDDYGAGEEIHHCHDDCLGANKTDLTGSADAVEDDTHKTRQGRPEYQRHSSSRSSWRMALGGSVPFSGWCVSSRDGCDDIHDDESDGVCSRKDGAGAGRTKLVPSGNELWS